MKRRNSLGLAAGKNKAHNRNCEYIQNDWRGLTYKIQGWGGTNHVGPYKEYEKILNCIIWAVGDYMTTITLIPFKRCVGLLYELVDGVE